MSVMDPSSTDYAMYKSVLEQWASWAHLFDINHEETVAEVNLDNDATAEEVTAEEVEQEKEQKKSSSSGVVYTLERWHPSTLRHGAVCGYVF